MPNTFTAAGQVCGISLTTLYTAPSSNLAGTVTSSIIIMLQAANVTSRADVITMVWTDASNSNAVTRLAFQVPIPAGQSVGLLTGKMVMNPGDTLRAQCGIFQAIEIVASIVEIG